MAVVSIVRSKSTDESRIADMVHSVLEPLGGLEKFVSAGDRVVLKPNFVTNRKYFTGATTDPEIILAMIRKLSALDVKDITVADSSWTGCSTERAFNATGIKGICDREGVKLVDLKKDRFVKVKVPEGRELEGHVEIARTILDADKIINLPKLKAHSQTIVTLSLKNLKGCISDDEKRRFHRIDIDRAIAELNTVLKPDLIVLDGIIGEMTAELGCDPIRLDTIVAGTDPVAVDSICSTMMGFEPNEIEYIVHAERLGIGKGLDPAGIDVIGDVDLREISDEIPKSVGFERYKDAFQSYGIDICEKSVCSSCHAALYLALKRISDESGLENLKGSRIFIGQDIVPTYTHLVGGDSGSDKRMRIGIGKCSLELDGLDVMIKGCPPSALKIYKKLRDDG